MVIDFAILDGLALLLGPRRPPLHLGLRGLPGVENKLLEIFPIHQILELSLENDSPGYDGSYHLGKHNTLWLLVLSCGMEVTSGA